MRGYITSEGVSHSNTLLSDSSHEYMASSSLRLLSLRLRPTSMVDPITQIDKLNPIRSTVLSEVVVVLMCSF